MNLWSSAQNSDRWKLFRLGTWSHNVPMIDGCQQLVKGSAKVTEVKCDGAASVVTLDLSSLYTNATSVIRRGEMAASGRSYTLRDTFRRRKAGREYSLGDDDARQADHRGGQGDAAPGREVHYADPVWRAEGHLDDWRRTGTEQMGFPQPRLSPVDVLRACERRRYRFNRRQLFGQLGIVVWRLHNDY